MSNNTLSSAISSLRNETVESSITPGRLGAILAALHDVSQDCTAEAQAIIAEFTESFEGVLHFAGFASAAAQVRQQGCLADGAEMAYHPGVNCFVARREGNLYSSVPGGERYGEPTFNGYRPLSKLIYVCDADRSVYLYNGTALVLLAAGITVYRSGETYTRGQVVSRNNALYLVTATSTTTAPGPSSAGYETILTAPTASEYISLSNAVQGMDDRVRDLDADMTTAKQNISTAADNIDDLSSSISDLWQAQPQPYVPGRTYYEDSIVSHNNVLYRVTSSTNTTPSPDNGNYTVLVDASVIDADVVEQVHELKGLTTALTLNYGRYASLPRPIAAGTKYTLHSTATSRIGVAESSDGSTHRDMIYMDAGATITRTAERDITHFYAYASDDNLFPCALEVKTQGIVSEIAEKSDNAAAQAESLANDVSTILDSAEGMKIAKDALTGLDMSLRLKNNAYKQIGHTIPLGTIYKVTSTADNQFALYESEDGISHGRAITIYPGETSIVAECVVRYFYASGMGDVLPTTVNIKVESTLVKQAKEELMADLPQNVEEFRGLAQIAAQSASDAAQFASQASQAALPDLTNIRTDISNLSDTASLHTTSINEMRSAIDYHYNYITRAQSNMAQIEQDNADIKADNNNIKSTLNTHEQQLTGLRDDLDMYMEYSAEDAQAIQDIIARLDAIEQRLNNEEGES